MQKTLRRSMIGLAGAAALATGATLLVGGVSTSATFTAQTTSTAAANKGWRITYTADSNTSLRDIVALNAKEAWAVGNVLVKGKPQPLVQRWNGQRWVRPALPATAKGTYLVSVSASSGSNVWIGGTDGTTRQVVLHWNGRRWNVTTTFFPAGTRTRPAAAPSASGPPPTTVDTVFGPRMLAFGAKDVWQFGQTKAAPTADVAQHFDGTRWSVVPSPADLTEFSAVSPNDIWAIGVLTAKRDQPAAVLHWDGSTWSVKREFGGAEYGGIFARSARDVSVALAGVKPASLLHWNGTTWVESRVPGTNTILAPFTSDGKSGFWSGELMNGRVYHYQAARWTSTPTPTPKGGHGMQVDSLAWIPGTTSVWGLGSVFNDLADTSVLLKYGS
jgi:hypothetical protein